LRIPNETHEAQPWRIREILPDFHLEDVWALPAHGDADEFPALLEMMASLDPAEDGSLPTRVLWRTRDLMGRWFGLGRTSPPTPEERDGDPSDLPIPGTDEISLSERLPDDLRGSASDLGDRTLSLFSPLYLTDDEFAAEISNQTVHGVIHLVWVERGGGDFQGQMAIYVKPRGRFGKGYMKLISPFRHLIVYPEMMRQIERRWNLMDHPEALR